MPKFRVEDTFTIQSRLLFCLFGDILEGTIQKGMVFSIPLNSQLSMYGVIRSIEFIRKPGGVEKIAFTVQCENEDEMETWKMLNIKNEEIEVSEPG